MCCPKSKIVCSLKPCLLRVVLRKVFLFTRFVYSPPLPPFSPFLSEIFCLRFNQMCNRVCVFSGTSVTIYICFNASKVSWFIPKSPCQIHLILCTLLCVCGLFPIYGWSVCCVVNWTLFVDVSFQTSC